MNYIPIYIEFDVQDRNIDVDFSITNVVDITVVFKATYRRSKRYKNYLGDGYVGQRLSNTRL